MVRKDVSLAEKIIKLFLDENVVLNKSINDKKPDIWFKDLHFTVEVDEGNHKNYDTGEEKEREDMFKRHNIKTIKCNPNHPGFDIYKFSDEINSYVTKLRQKSSG